MIGSAQAPAKAIPLEAALAGAVSRGTGIGIWPIATPAGLIGAEEGAARRMRPDRLREFSAGRAAARIAMRGAGVLTTSVPMGPDRAPQWPAGVFGTISHAGAYAVAAVRAASRDMLLGVDLAEDTGLDPLLWDIVLSDADCAWLADQPQRDWPHLAKLIFSAKEAVYKAQYPITRTLFDFHVLGIHADPVKGTFRARFLRDIGPFSAGFAVTGLARRCDGYILTSVDFQP
jgi:4'-phosphopantetheinyl transferase EntD